MGTALKYPPHNLYSTSLPLALASAGGEPGSQPGNTAQWYGQKGLIVNMFNIQLLANPSTTLVA